MSGPIHNQFNLWGLSKSEADIAYLLVKGFTIREIADLRKTTEATVRQQTLQLYQKAQVDGRHQLSGFFIKSWLGHCSESEPGSQ